LLVESDYPFINDCGPRTWDMVGIMAQARGWRVEEEGEEWKINEDDISVHKESWGTVRRLEVNWQRFIRGGHRKRGKR